MSKKYYTIYYSIFYFVLRQNFIILSAFLLPGNIIVNASSGYSSVNPVVAAVASG